MFCIKIRLGRYYVSTSLGKHLTNRWKLSMAIVGMSLRHIYLFYPTARKDGVGTYVWIFLYDLQPFFNSLQNQVNILIYHVPLLKRLPAILNILQRKINIIHLSKYLHSCNWKLKWDGNRNRVTSSIVIRRVRVDAYNCYVYCDDVQRRFLDRSRPVVQQLCPTDDASI